MREVDIGKIFSRGPVELRCADERYSVELSFRPPCTSACPAGVNVKSYVNLIADKRYEDALRVVLESNPFPGICGRVCTHPCEGECSLGKYTDPIAIRSLKRFAADYEMSRRPLSRKRNRIVHREKIAIVGAGPAGLTVASDLSDEGYEVTVFERAPIPGGMLVLGIPRYRLPRSIVDFEIGSIRAKGVDIRLNHEVGNAQELFDNGYSAVIIAAGAVKDRSLHIPGSDRTGVLGSISFLERINLGGSLTLEGRVVVVGGGSSAFDAARTAVRCGANEVVVAYRRTEKEMPASSDEIIEAKEEGVKIITLAVPKSILGNDKVEAICFARTRLGEVDESGRKVFIPIDGSDFELEADVVISAIGSEPDIPGFARELETTKWNTIEIDDLCMTSGRNVFACGDVVTGPATVIDAIASGHRAARGVHSSLRGMTVPEEEPRAMVTVIEEPERGRSECVLSTVKSSTESRGFQLDNVCGIVVPKGRFRFTQQCLDAAVRTKCFEEVAKGSSEPETVLEASRCGKCGSCHECNVCLPSCDHKQVYATLGDVSFLMRIPLELFEEIDRGQVHWNIVTPEGELPVNLRSITPSVDPDKCVACGKCEESCAYNAVQVRLTTDTYPKAVIYRDICKQCGGCAAVCPSGAITQGPLSMDVLAERLLEIVRIDPHKPVLSAAYWTVRQAAMDNEILEVMCTRMLTPGLLIRAFALGSPGLLIIASPEDVGCHYLPSSGDIGEVVERTKQLLEFVGIDPARIGLKEGKWSEREILLQEFKEELPPRGRSGIQRNSSPPSGNNSPMLDAMAQLECLAEMPDDGLETFSMSDKTSLSYVEFLNRFFMAHGFSVLDEMNNTIRIFRDNPGSAGKISTMKDLAVHLSASSVLADRTPARTNKVCRTEKICLLRCPGDERYGAEVFARMLENVPDVSIVQVRSEYSGSDWFRFTRSLRTGIDNILREVEEHNADLLLTISPFTTAAMRLLTRKGSWVGRNVMVRDVISYLAGNMNSGLGGLQ